MENATYYILVIMILLLPLRERFPKMDIQDGLIDLMFNFTVVSFGIFALYERRVYGFDLYLDFFMIFIAGSYLFVKR